MSDKTDNLIEKAFKDLDESGGGYLLINFMSQPKEGEEPTLERIALFANGEDAEQITLLLAAYNEVSDMMGSAIGAVEVTEVDDSDTTQ